jgi:hypothetical protein
MQGSMQESGAAGELYARLRAAMSDLPDDSAVELLGDLDRLLDGEMALMHEVLPARRVEPRAGCHSIEAALACAGKRSGSTGHV